MIWSRSRYPDPNTSLHLSGNERRLLTVSLLLLPTTIAAHRVLGYRRLLGALETILPITRRVRARRVPDCAEKELELAESVSRIVQIASNRTLLHPTCLQQSIYLWWLLASRGLSANLRVGVRKKNDRFEAHAWIEFRGRVLNDTADVTSRYTPLADNIDASSANRL